MHHARDKIYEEGEREDGSGAEGGACHRVGEVVPAQGDDPGGYQGRDHAGDDHERRASRTGRGRPCRVMEQDAEDRPGSWQTRCARWGRTAGRGQARVRRTSLSNGLARCRIVASPPEA
jgi:hypothetical protein